MPFIKVYAAPQTMQNARGNGPLLSPAYLHVDFAVLIYTKNREARETEESERGQISANTEYKTGG